MNRDKILERIVKLFALGGEHANTTEHEMMAAITAAKRLMAQYNIHLADVESASGKNIKDVQFAVHRHVAYTRKMTTLAAYDHNVALAVEKLTQTRALIHRVVRGGSRYVSMQFVGGEADTHIAAELFLTLLGSVRRFARTARGTGWSHAHTSYALGFSARLIDRAKEMALDLTPQEARTYALVVQTKEQQLARWMDENATGTDKRRKSSIDYSSYSEGYRDGARLSLGLRGLPGQGE